MVALMTAETIRWTDRDDTLVFVTADGVVPVSKHQLGIKVTKDVVPGRVDVSSLPRSAVTIFLRYLMRQEFISEELSMKGVGTLIHLAEVYRYDDLLQQLKESIIRASTINERALCLCYILACACDLHIKTQLARSIAIKFDKIKAIVKQLIEDSEMLTPILERCDIATSLEKELIIFVIEWTSVHESTREECVRLLNCTRKILISPIDLESLSVYVRKNASESMKSAWETYMNTSNTMICWHSKHIMEKWPRCGIGKLSNPSGFGKQSKRVTFTLPTDDGVVAEHHTKTASPQLNRRKISEKSENLTKTISQPPPPPQPPHRVPPKTTKNVLVRSLLKLRHKFTRKSTN